MHAVDSSIVLIFNQTIFRTESNMLYKCITPAQLAKLNQEQNLWSHQRIKSALWRITNFLWKPELHLNSYILMFHQLSPISIIIVLFFLQESETSFTIVKKYKIIILFIYYYKDIFTN